MGAIQSAFTNGFGSNPVVSGAAAPNEVLTSSSSTAAAWQLGLVRQAATPVAGYALINGTGNVITWTAPNDGAEHRFAALAAISVATNETGGAIIITGTNPDGTAFSHSLSAGGSSVGDVQAANSFLRVIEAGSTVTVQQSTALTLGAATLWAEIWGS